MSPVQAVDKMNAPLATKAPRETSLADPVLLEKIDKLFACNVGEYISLPQLVVVGDQSSGKSSVLEGLTKLSFPRDSGLCTRFATQIIFRRNTRLTEREISASILPEPGLSSEDDQKLREWRTLGIQTLAEQAFSEMMKEVITIPMSLWIATVLACHFHSIYTNRSWIGQVHQIMGLFYQWWRRKTNILQKCSMPRDMWTTGGPP
jgi:Dynamin family